MKLRFSLLLLLVTFQTCKSQQNLNDGSLESSFYQEQAEIGTPIFRYLNNNFYINSINEFDFTRKIDSLKSIYTQHLNKYKGKLDKDTFVDESFGINYAFDKYILEYPRHHKAITGNTISLSAQNLERLKKNLLHINDINLLRNRDFRSYVMAHISIEAAKRLESQLYDHKDNQQLNADWDIIEFTFKVQEVRDFWKQEYLFNHIDNMGIKNIDPFYDSFITSCKMPEYTAKIKDFYNSQKMERESHIIETYKKVNGFELEMHLFLPDTTVFKSNRPTLVHFHGGSWSIGKPDWFFEAAREYAKQGWIVAAVEYRIKGKQGTYPFQAVKDAKSSIRWLRENAAKYNIESSKILVTGNSSGGHLAISTALVEGWNETSDNLNVSAKPDALIVNSAVYDLTVDNCKWITENLENKELVKEISPNYLISKTPIKMYLVHGEKDTNCSFSSAEYFYNEMKLLGNPIELYTVKNATHMIWYGRHYLEVAKTTEEFIETLNYE